MYLTRMDKIKDRKYQILVRMGSKLEISCTASGRLKVTTTVQISLGGSSKLNTQIIYDQTVHLLGICSTETHISRHWIYIQQVYGSVICNRQNMATAQIPINSGMNGLWSYVSFKVLHSNKDAQITAKHTITRIDVTNIMYKRSPTVCFHYSTFTKKETQLWGWKWMVGTRGRRESCPGAAPGDIFPFSNMLFLTWVTSHVCALFMKSHWSVHFWFIHFLYNCYTSVKLFL